MNPEAIERAMDEDPGIDEEIVDDADEVDAGANDGADDAFEAEAEAPLILGKFRDQSALEKAYKELESKLGSRQPDPTPQPENLDDDAWLEDVPTMPLPLGGEPQTEEEFYGWLGQQPEAAAMWAIQNNDRLQPEFVINAVNAWASIDPTSHATFVASAQVEQMRQEMEQMRAEMAQQLQPHQQQLQQQVVDTTRQMIAQAIPDEAQRLAAAERISTNPMLQQLAAQARTPAEAVEVARMAHNLNMAEAWQQQQAAVAAGQPIQRTQQRAVTRTRQAPARSTADDDEGDAIVAAANRAQWA